MIIMLRSWMLSLWFICVGMGVLSAQDSAGGDAKLLISGPMLGYVEHREVMIWLEVSSEVEAVAIDYWEKEHPDEIETHFFDEALGFDYNPIKIALGGLKMNTEYEYRILLNGEPVELPYPLTFKTKELWEWRKDPPDFSFLFGSCVYINDPEYDRPGKPYGQSRQILEKMADTPGDFVIWGGDNLYLREADYSSASGIRYRYSTQFSIPELQKVRATKANYAIWDDHDYGPDDSNDSYELKEVALEVFTKYWGNKSFGEANHPGAYTRFKWSDAEFFLMDDRSYRAPKQLPDSIGGKPNPDKVFYGRRQLDWLEHGLISTESHFKFIVTGNQALNPMAGQECFYQYPLEWQELMTFIRERHIEGVVFLTGDRHFSELIRYEQPGSYPLYDFTCSAITSGVAHLNPNSAEFNNPSRVPGSLLMENNYGRISVSGKKGERVITFETYDVDGVKKWSYSVR